MDNLPPCAVTIAAVALGLVPGRAIPIRGFDRPGHLPRAEAAPGGNG